MSNTLILMRHLDTSKKEQGEAEVRNVAQQMIAADVTPDIIVYSPAERTAKTALLVAEEYKSAGKEITLKPDKRLAESHNEIPAVIFSLPSNVGAALIISHKPDILEAFGSLTGMYEGLEHATAARFRASEDGWKQIATSGENRIIQQFTPK